MLRFHTPLVELDGPDSGIQLSDRSLALVLSNTVAFGKVRPG